MAHGFFAKFICVKDENHTQKELVWINDHENDKDEKKKKSKIKCNTCGSKMKQEVIEVDDSFNIGGKQKQRSREEGWKRSYKNFRETVLPTINKKDREHFIRKHGIKNKYR